MQYDQPTSSGDFQNSLEQDTTLDEGTRNAIEQVLGTNENPDRLLNVGNVTVDPETGELTVQQPVDENGEPAPLDVVVLEIPPGTDPQQLQEIINKMPDAKVFIFNSDDGIRVTFGSPESSQGQVQGEGEPVFSGETGATDPSGGVTYLDPNALNPTDLSRSGTFVIDSPEGATITFGAQAKYNVVPPIKAIDRVIVGDNGDDFITVADNGNTTLDGGDGNDTLVTTGGYDSITGGAGDDSISSGGGDDTIVSTLGNDTIDGGTGYDLVTLGFAKSDATFTAENGVLVVSDGITSVTLSNVEFLTFSDGGTTTITNDALVGTTMRLYQTVLDRAPEYGGAKYWAANADDHYTIVDLGMGFIASQEFANNNPNIPMTDEQFINLLYQNTFNRDAEPAGVEHWANWLSEGLTHAELTMLIADSPEAQLLNGINGNATVIQLDGWDWV